MGERAGKDFFVSYAAVDEPWAVWICEQLEEAGYTTVSQPLDLPADDGSLRTTQEAARTAGRTIAVLSPAYTDSALGEAEWGTASATEPIGGHGLLISVRVRHCHPTGRLATRVYIDLVDLAEPIARERLLAAVGPTPQRPATASYPGATVTAARFPGAGPPVSNLPHRNPHFTGRNAELEHLHRRVRDGTVTAVVPRRVVHDLGGIGKSELVTEFAHRYAGDYDITWFINAEHPTTTSNDLAALAIHLGHPAEADQAATVNALLDHLRGIDRWLLIYDNAPYLTAMDGMLPAVGGGAVLVTSRWTSWGPDATALRTTVWTRAESVRFLRDRITSGGLPGTGRPDAEQADARGWDELAELTGNLPLALEEAAAYLEQTRLPLHDYLTLLRERAHDLFGLSTDAPDWAGDGSPGDTRRVATVWSVSLDQVHTLVPQAGQVLELFAFLAADIPRTLLAEHPDALPEAAARVVGDPTAFDELLIVLSRYSLIELTSERIRMHRLLQAAIRTRLDLAAHSTIVTALSTLLRALFPDDSAEIATWPRCATLLPHLRTICAHAGQLDISAEQNGWLLHRASSYLRARGQYQQARPLAQQALAQTENALNGDHIEVARRRDELASVQRGLDDSTLRNNLGNVLQDLEHPQINQTVVLANVDVTTLVGETSHLNAKVRILVDDLNVLVARQLRYHPRWYESPAGTFAVAALSLLISLLSYIGDRVDAAGQQPTHSPPPTVAPVVPHQSGPASDR